ncbi:MAG: AAA family ATPase [Bacteroidales bacterium]|jgi:predicted ATPase|nr:AAA family ATPase [Bacteroidales bacterium]
MRISKISLINWKNFRKTEVELPYRVFIVGPNASGKSNFLDAIRFLRDIVKQGGGLQESVSTLRGGISKIRCVAARSNTDITVGVVVNNGNDLPEWEYRLAFNQTGGGIVDLRVLVKEEFLKNLITEKYISIENLKTARVNIRRVLRISNRRRVMKSSNRLLIF